MTTYRLAKMPGDGIGPEIVAEGVKVIEKAAELNNFKIEWKEYDNAAKDIEHKKDTLLDEVEMRLKQKTKEESLFTIKWEIK